MESDQTGRRLEENDDKNYWAWDGYRWVDYRVGADSFTYNLGRGVKTSDIDSVFDWRVEVTAADGRTYVTLMNFIQFENGDIFSNIDATIWNKDIGGQTQIKSIKLISYGSGLYYGTINKQNLGNVAVVTCFEESVAILKPRVILLVLTGCRSRLQAAIFSCLGRV